MNHTKQVIHVDDDADILEITRLSIELFGKFDLRQFKSAKELLSELCDLNPNIFLLDVMMPEMDGPALLSEIRQRKEFENTPAAFMTAVDVLDFNENYFGTGPVYYIGKPFDPISLPEKLNTFMRGVDNDDVPPGKLTLT